MRIVDRYIAREFAGPFLFGVCAFSMAFIAGGTVWRIAQYISKYGASGKVVIKLFLYSLPGVIAITLPMAVLLAALLCYGRLSGTSEIIVMRSCGLPFLRLSLPILALALAISLGGILLQGEIAPKATTAYNNLVQNEIQRNTRPRSQEHIVIVENLGKIERITYARTFDDLTGTMYPVTVQEHEGDRLIYIQQATKAVWQKGSWMMYDGTIYEAIDGGTRTIKFAKQLLPISKSPANIPLEKKTPEEMTIRELKQRTALLRLAGQATAPYDVELHQRLAIPLASMVFAFIGAPLGLAPHRSSSATGLGLSMLIIFLYYVVMTYATALGRAGTLPAAFAAWLPDAIGLAVGLVLTIWVDKRDSIRFPI